MGAGPGDPDLLTVAARRLIDQADVVVHDRLVGDAILATIPEGTLRVNVGKAGYHGGADQGDINAHLVRLVQEGYDVVRLKGGDPFVFGRGGEELLELAAEGIEVRVVPGITAGLAGPAAFGIPATHRGLSRSVAFVTGHAVTRDDPSTDAPGSPDWSAIARIDTVVVYMGGRTAPAIAARLLAAGRDAVHAGRGDRLGHDRPRPDRGAGPGRAGAGRAARRPRRRRAAGDRRGRPAPRGARRGDRGR